MAKNENDAEPIEFYTLKPEYNPMNRQETIDNLRRQKESIRRLYDGLKQSMLDRVYAIAVISANEYTYTCPLKDSKAVSDFRESHDAMEGLAYVIYGRMYDGHLPVMEEDNAKDTS